MPKEEWGVKRLCPTTGRRFYDLNRSPVVSPYTGDVVNLEAGNKSRVLVADKADPKSVKATLDEDDTDVIDEVEDDDVDLGDDVLDDEDDDSVSLDEIADVTTDDED